MIWRSFLTVMVAACGAAGTARATPPASAPAGLLATDLARAEQVQRSVQQRFWDDRRQLYVGEMGHDAPADMWTAGIAFSALDGAARYQPATYLPILRSDFRSLDRYWDRNEALPGYEPLPTDGNGHDKYYDDNAWIAIALTQAYDLTGDASMLERARRTTDFVLSGWDDQLGGGIWWHEGHKGGSKNTCSNAPAAVACLAVARRLASGDEADARAAAGYRAAARRIVEWTLRHLQNRDGTLGDHIDVATGHVNHGALTYNTALMIQAQLMLARQGGTAADLANAEREARAAERFVDRRTGRYRDAVKWSHLLVEADLAVARQTRDPALAWHLAQRARAAVDADYANWQANPSAKLIDVASLARELWALSDADAPAGQAFGRPSDGSAQGPAAPAASGATRPDSAGGN